MTVQTLLVQYRLDQNVQAQPSSQPTTVMQTVTAYYPVPKSTTKSSFYTANAFKTTV